MKAVLLSLFVISFSLWGVEPKVVSFDKLQKRGKVGSQLTYIPNQDTPFTGKAVSFYSNGQKKVEATFKDGKRDGLITTWYADGQKKWEENKRDGLATEWYENGQKKMEINFKDDKPDGLTTEWYENGQKMSEENYRNGKGDGLITTWYADGQKRYVGNYKDGKLMSAEVWKPNGEKCPVTNIDEERNGVVVEYKEYGTERERLIFKDGEPVRD